jgi:diguanylate cyclase (GGDEF)-like protein
MEVGTLIKRTMRGSDLLFRFGGDEFLVLLLNTSSDKSIHMVQRLLTAVDGWNIENADAYGYHLSFSMGCSTYEKGCDILEALKEADDRMYQNKMGKRNKAIED